MTTVDFGQSQPSCIALEDNAYHQTMAIAILLKEAQVSLAKFIQDNSTPIVREWERFARGLAPVADQMGELTLRNDIRQILAAIAGEIESGETPSGQGAQAAGRIPQLSFPATIQVHGALRFDGGFDMDQVVAEFRALRASIVKLWYASVPEVHALDIRELTRFDDAVDRAMTEAVHDYSRQLDTSRSLFLGILSHDPRNPLAAISMAAQLTSKMRTLDARQTMLQSQIIDSAKRASEIVSNLLDLTRARLGTSLTTVIEPTDMGFIANRIVGEMCAQHPSRDFLLSMSGTLDGLWDKARLGQLFSNLLSNAVQYGSKDAPIRMTVKGQPADVVISIHNEGIPVSLQHIDTIFDAMTRGDESADVSGVRSQNLGLGLFISREIVSAHGGTIGVESGEGDGTTFTIQLPRTATGPIAPIPHPVMPGAQELDRRS